MSKRDLTTELAEQFEQDTAVLVTYMRRDGPQRYNLLRIVDTMPGELYRPQGGHAHLMTPDSANAGLSKLYSPSA